MSADYHHTWCAECNSIQVHLRGRCIKCQDNIKRKIELKIKEINTAIPELSEKEIKVDD